MAKTICYRFSVTATLPLTDDMLHPDFYTETAATSAERQNNYTRAVMAALRRVEGDCVVELLDYTVEDDDAA